MDFQRLLALSPEAGPFVGKDDMRYTVLPALLLAALTSTPALALPWGFDSYEEDWGLTCDAGIKMGFDHVGFFAAPGQEIVGYFTETSLPAETRVTYQVDGRSWTLAGSASEYSGNHEVGDIPNELLDAIAAGSLLEVKIEGAGRIDVPLDGSAKALKQFFNCMDQG